MASALRGIDMMLNCQARGFARHVGAGRLHSVEGGSWDVMLPHLTSGTAAVCGFLSHHSSFLCEPVGRGPLDELGRRGGQRPALHVP